MHHRCAVIIEALSHPPSCDVFSSQWVETIRTFLVFEELLHPYDVDSCRLCAVHHDHEGELAVVGRRHGHHLLHVLSRWRRLLLPVSIGFLWWKLRRDTRPCENAHGVA